MSDKQKDSRSRIPPINELIGLVRAACPNLDIPHELAVRLARMVAKEKREKGSVANDNDLIAGVVAPLLQPGPARVINATGIMLHTNLGRAPIDEDTVKRALATVKDYTNLELDLVSGKRGHRDQHFSRLARLVWGAEDATLVNNAAAGVALALSAIGAGGETVVSRGELIEIGGSFRLPDIMELAGTRIKEVGTTNKTKPTDYENASGPETRCFLKTHTSNYRIEGFTREVSLAELVAVGKTKQVPVIMDLGSGLSSSLTFPKVDEPFIEDYLADGPDLLIFSGDKLFGGVQAGIILGSRHAIAKLRKHPMMRMLRGDKLLISMICHQLANTVTIKRNAFSQLAAASIAELETRAAQLVAGCNALKPRVVPDKVFMGGGSLPQETRPSVCLVFDVAKPERFAKHLRLGNPGVVGYIRENRFYLNLASVFPEQDTELVEALNAAAPAHRST